MATATPLVLPRTKVLWIEMGLKTIQIIVIRVSCVLSANRTGQGLVWGGKRFLGSRVAETDVFVAKKTGEHWHDHPNGMGDQIH